MLKLLYGILFAASALLLGLGLHASGSGGPAADGAAWLLIGAFLTGGGGLGMLLLDRSK